jgi:hypothetical protein
MFHSPQAVIGLALLPMTWASSTAAEDRARSANAGEQRAREDDLVRYFPAGWTRESVPDWPAVGARAAAPLLRRVKSRWQASALAALLARSGGFVRRRLLRRPVPALAPRRGLSRG